MSKARLVITAVLVEGRSQWQVARDYGVCQGWISRLIKRYTAEGDAAFEPRSRRPRRLPQTTIDLFITLRHSVAGKVLDAGPHSIAWHLQHHHQLHVSPASISHHLHAAGLVEPTPQKRPNSSYIRFAAQQPNQRWQSDFTHWRLSNGTDVEILCWLDDCSRLALSVTAHRRITGAIVVAEFTKTIAQHGIPYSTLTDNGMIFTTRFAGGKGGRTLRPVWGSSAAEVAATSSGKKLRYICRKSRWRWQSESDRDHERGYEQSSDHLRRNIPYRLFWLQKRELFEVRLASLPP